MSRNYTPRRSDTKGKTYEDYLELRKSLESKGYQLKAEMSEESFNAYYERLRAAKREGEISSSAWQTLKSKSISMSSKQSEVFKKAFENMRATDPEQVSAIGLDPSRNMRASDFRKLDPGIITILGQYINATKHTGIYGGTYE